MTPQLKYAATLPLISIQLQIYQGIFSEKKCLNRLRFDRIWSRVCGHTFWPILFVAPRLFPTSFSEVFCSVFDRRSAAQWTGWHVWQHSRYFH